VRKTLRAIFWALVGVFVLVVSNYILILLLPEYQIPDIFFIFPNVLLAILGPAMCVFTYKTQVNKRLRQFLLLTGYSAAGIGALFIPFFIVTELTQTENLLFISIYFLGTWVCLLSCLVGIMGSIRHLRKLNEVS
jgi:peptidoglycan/LPS O-acetylase OafA/YrhL